jgi:hypothetical protein
MGDTKILFFTSTSRSFIGSKSLTDIAAPVARWIEFDCAEKLTEQ